MSLPLPSPAENGLALGSHTILCSYRNASDRMVIVRARGVDAYFLERVVFPFEVMTFRCPRECEVEVLMRTPAGLEQSEWFAAEELHAPEHARSSEPAWRPRLSVRTVNVRGNASSVCRTFL